MGRKLTGLQIVSNIGSSGGHNQSEKMCPAPAIVSGEGKLWAQVISEYRFPVDTGRLLLAGLGLVVTLPLLKHRRRQSQPVRSSRTAPTALSDSGDPRPRTINDKLYADPRRQIIFKVIALVVVPLLLICALEAILRLAGYGYATAFFKPLRIDNEEYLVENDKFGWRFFTPEVSRSPTPVRMLAHKPPGTYRIFLFGESAALGDPEPAFGMGRYLQALLRERYPQARFEVVCAAMTAINSHAVLSIARECAAYEGDLWIVYMGNNEMIGPFGAITVFGAQAPPLGYVRLSLAAQRTRLGQLFASLGRRLRGASPSQGSSWGGLQMFLNNKIRPDDRRKEIVYQSFERNLEDILRTGRAAGVPMVLSTVAVNLRDCAPFSSFESTNLTSGADSAEFRQLISQASKAYETADFAGAVRNFSAAEKLAPDFADLHFQWGQSLLGLGNSSAARVQFEQACDDDALPFRADSRINKIIKESARRLSAPDLSLCDAASIAAAASPVGIPGGESFYEHVHFNFSGNYRLALALADSVKQSLPAALRRQENQAWASEETCERDLGLTDWNRAEVYENVQRRLLQPPFTAQAANAQKAKALDLPLQELRTGLNPTNIEPAQRVYLDAIRRWPDDFRLYANQAAFLEANRDLVGAVTDWKRVHELLPHYYLAPYEIGRLLARQDQADQARSWLNRALEMRPDLSEGWFELGRVQGAGGQFEEALASFDRARQLVPAEPRYHCEMAKALVKLNRRDEAIAQLQEAVSLGPISWEAHYLLGEQLAFAGRLDAARDEFEKTIRLNPRYPMAHMNLGVALTKTGKFEEARQQFQETLNLDPQNRAARQALSQLSGGRL